MSNDILTSKIELLQDQIDNLEKSGFFTEAEMDRACSSLRIEKAYYEYHLNIGSSENDYSQFESQLNVIDDDEKQLYGMTPEDYADGMKYHNNYFDQINTIEVIDAEILNTIEA